MFRSGIILFGMLFGMVLLPSFFAMFNPKRQITYEELYKSYQEDQKERQKEYQMEIEMEEIRKKEALKKKEEDKLLRQKQFNNYSSKHIASE